MRVRDSVRLLVFDAERRLLLIRVRENVAKSMGDTTGGYRVYWITPGGGMEPGESEEQTARREMVEETGIEAHTLGPKIGYLEQTLMWGDAPMRCRERYYVVHTRTNEITTHGLTANEREVHQEYRWWPIDELMATMEPVLPAVVRELANDYLARGAPSSSGVRQIISP